MPINVLLIREIDKYIRSESGGSHRVFAKKLGVSQSTLSRHIRFMKNNGAPICYDYDRKTHFYDDIGEFVIVIGFKQSIKHAAQHTNDRQMVKY